MWVLKGIGCVVAVLLALAVVVGGGVLIAIALAIGGALTTLFVIGTIVVLATSELYEKVIRPKRR